jgi:hypothetical protein
MARERAGTALGLKERAHALSRFLCLGRQRRRVEPERLHPCELSSAGRIG